MKDILRIISGLLSLIAGIFITLMYTTYRGNYKTFFIVLGIMVTTGGIISLVPSVKIYRRNKNLM
jgi:uncharacterized membrane protein HdeD (DUF308 family)